ncbi:MAG TPA: hypothetical protein VGN37_15050 [Actinocatenispora sp.]
MTGVVARVVLGVCGVAAVVGGVPLVVMIYFYFGPDSRYVPELLVGQYGIVAVLLALGLYVGGVLRIPVVARVLVGLMAAGGGVVVLVVFTAMASFLGDPGGERGTLEDASPGIVCVLAGAWFVWRAIAGRWPVTEPAPRIRS